MRRSAVLVLLGLLAACREPAVPQCSDASVPGLIRQIRDKYAQEVVRKTVDVAMAPSLEISASYRTLLTEQIAAAGDSSYEGKSRAALDSMLSTMDKTTDSAKSAGMAHADSTAASIKFEYAEFTTVSTTPKPPSAVCHAQETILSPGEQPRTSTIEYTLRFTDAGTLIVETAPLHWLRDQP